MQPTPVFLPGEFPWTEEPGGLQSMGSQRVRHDLVTDMHARTGETWIARGWNYLVASRSYVRALGWGDLKAGLSQPCWVETYCLSWAMTQSWEEYPDEEASEERTFSDRKMSFQKQHVFFWEIALGVIWVLLSRVFSVPAGTAHLGSRHMEAYLRNQTQRVPATTGLHLMRPPWTSRQEFACGKNVNNLWPGNRIGDCRP